MLLEGDALELDDVATLLVREVVEEKEEEGTAEGLVRAVEDELATLLDDELVRVVDEEVSTLLEDVARVLDDVTAGMEYALEEVATVVCVLEDALDERDTAALPDTDKLEVAA